jgi:hypothetical protein
MIASMGRLGVLAVVAVVLAGCDAVFGLTEVHPGDANDGPRVTGHYHQLYVTNDQSFAPVVTDRTLLPGTVGIAVTLDDGTQSIVDYASDGTFSFALAHAGQPYRLVTSISGLGSEYQTAAPVLRLVNLLAGRPDRMPIFPSTVQFAFPDAMTATSPAYVMSTGLYTQSNTGQYGPVSFDWRLSQPTSGALLGLLDAAHYDELFAVELESDTVVAGLPWTTIKGVSRASVTQVPSGVVALPQPLPVSKNACLRMTSPGTAIRDRLVGAAPRAYTSYSGNWYAYMAPAPDQMGTAGALWTVQCGFTGPLDLAVTAPFHDPFTGMTLLVQSTVVASYDVMVPGTTIPYSYPTYTSMWDRAERGTPTSCSPAVTILDSKVALPSIATLDTTPLDNDGQTVALDLTRDVPITWSIATPGPVDFYGVSVHELTNLNGKTYPVQRASLAVAGQTSAFIDRAVFVPGHWYIIAITTSLGRPNAAQGDWETITLPLENAGVYSHYFQVQAR